MWQTIWKLARGEHGGKLLGVVAGIFCGFLYLFAGFWDMLIFTFIVCVGYYIGRRFDDRLVPIDIKWLWHWLTKQWRGFK